MSGVPTNRTTIGLPADVAQEILAKTQEASAVMTLARRIDLPGRGVEIPVITSDPTAEWVSETGSKPVSNPGLTKKIMSAYKLAVIVPFSNEFRRDAAALYDELVRRLPLALARQFDATVIGGTAPGSNFDVLTACTPYDIGSGTYGQLVAANAEIAAAGGDLNGFALSPQGKGVLLGAVDKNDRPLFVNNATEGMGDLVLGAPVAMSKGAYVAGTPDDIVGAAGDWTQALYGTVEGVTIDYSSDATLIDANNKAINLFQQNMFAVRAEIEVGFRADTNCFALLTKDAESES